MNIANILKNCPQGTKLYSPVFGDVYFSCANNSINLAYPIVVETSTDDTACFTADGKFCTYYDGECMLFPSKDNRDWSTFKSPKKYNFKPFDKVLVRNLCSDKWRIDLFSYTHGELSVCLSTVWKYCIPYKGNEHLLGTTDNSE